MRLPPIEVLESWPAPNYTNPPTRGDALLIVNSIFIGLVILTVGLRLYTRIVIKRWFGLDDVFIVLALVFTIALTAIVLLANQSYGWDRHVWDIPLNRIESTLKIAMVAKIMFTAAASFTRLSLLCFYYRLVADSGKTWFTWLVHANLAYTMGIFISFPFIAIFMCRPVKNYWIFGAPADTCMDEGIATLVCGIINCVADLTTTITPLPLVLRLMLPKRQRIAVTILFSMGFIVTIAGVVRTWFIYRSLIKSWDQTWYAYPLWIAAAVEIHLGVICASAPVLRPLLTKISFSLSDTFSRGGTVKKSNSSDPTPKVSRAAADPSASSSKRRLEAIRAAPELGEDRGKSYELKKWKDIEQGHGIEEGDGDSQDAILEDDKPQGSNRMRGIWNKIKSDKDESQDMTITLTSEVEWQVEPASGGGHMSSRRT